MRAIPTLLLAATVPAMAGGVQASIELLPQADVAAGEVVLGEVARLHGTDLGVIRMLVNLPVGRAPRQGESAILQRADLARWIRRQTGIAPDALEWTGPSEARVVYARPMPPLEPVLPGASRGNGRARAQREAEPLAVARGEWAVLRATEGSITLESRVEVLQDGRTGERVRVRAQGVTGPLFARVLAPGRLELAP